MPTPAALLLAAGSLCALAAASPAQLVSIGVPAGATSSYATGVSADGTVVSATAWSSSPSFRRAYRWTSAHGLQPLSPQGADLSAYGVSGDGATIVGSASNFEMGSSGGFLHHEQFGYQVLADPILDSPTSAHAVNADGGVIVGTAQFPEQWPPRTHAMRWNRESAAFEDLGVLPGYAGSAAYAMSADGSVICGDSWLRPDSNVPERAVRWTDAGIEPLPVLPGHEMSSASGISYDGSTIVGWSFPNDTGWRVHPIRWRNAEVQALRFPIDTPRGAAITATNADGSVCVGAILNDDPVTFEPRNHAALWTPFVGAVDLNSYLPTIGIDTTGWVLELASAVNADGRTIVGYGVYLGQTRGYVLSLPLPCGTADFNNDGDYGTDSDIEAFFACLGGNCCPSCPEAGADFNADGDTGTDADIEAFFRVLGGGPC